MPVNDASLPEPSLPLESTTRTRTAPKQPSVSSSASSSQPVSTSTRASGSQPIPVSRSSPQYQPPPHKPRIATVSLAGCFGCHMSLLDIDERLFTLFDIVEFDRSPLTDIKHCGSCDVGLIEGGLCNAENVHVLREFRAACRVIVGVGACAITGGLPAQRNAMDIGQILTDVYSHRPGLSADSQVPDDPELPLPLARVHAIQDVVHVDHFLPGCPPGADAIWAFLTTLLAGEMPHLSREHIHYD